MTLQSSFGTQLRCRVLETIWTELNKFESETVCYVP